MSKPEPYHEWASPDLADQHSDLIRLRRCELGDAGWMDKMQAAADLVKAADIDLRRPFP